MRPDRAGGDGGAGAVMEGKHKRARICLRLAHAILAAKGALSQSQQTEFRRVSALLDVKPEQVWEELGGVGDECAAVSTIRGKRNCARPPYTKDAVKRASTDKELSAMCAKWERDPSQIIRELNRCRSQSLGKVTYHAFAFERLQTTLTSFVKFNKVLHESQRSRLVAAALSTPTRNERISKGSLCRSITARESSYLRRPTRHFILVTSMSFKGKAPFQKFRLLNAQIIFRTNFEKFDMSKIKKLAQGQIFGRWPKDYTPVAVRTEARSESEAVPLAQDALDLLRSIWNLQLNTNFRMSFGRTQPVNAIRLGPFHTLYDGTGQPAGSQYWYEPDYLDPGKTIDITSQRNMLRDQAIKQGCSTLST